MWHVQAAGQTAHAKSHAARLVEAAIGQAPHTKWNCQDWRVFRLGIAWLHDALQG